MTIPINTTVYIKQGSYGTDSTLACTLIDPDGDITSLAGRTILFQIWQDPANPAASFTCIFDSGMTFHYVPASIDFLMQAGNYFYQIVIEGIATGRLPGMTGTCIVQPGPVSP
jgi:hypothetical protein